MGENKENENEQKGQGGPNPWIYDVPKVYPGQQYQQPGFGSSPMNPSPYGAPPSPPRQARRRGPLILWITLIVLVLLIAVSILILILIVR